MAAASQGELTGFVILILIFSAATLRYIIKDKVEASKDKFENNNYIYPDDFIGSIGSTGVVFVNTSNIHLFAYFLFVFLFLEILIYLIKK